MRSMILCFTLMLVCIAGKVCGGSVVDAHELISAADTAFAQANSADENASAALYQKAASLYQQAADTAGVQNAKLFYNIGNCYMLSGDLGRAVYNYKKALRLDSSDPLILRNLEAARSKRLDKVETKIETKVLARLCFWHYDFSPATRFYTALAVLSFMLLFFTAKVWFERLPGALPVGIIGAIVFVCFAASVAVETIHGKKYPQGVIVADSVAAKTGDSEKYDDAFKHPLHSGTEFELLEKRPQWLKVRLADGSEIWLPDEACLLL